MFVILKYSWPKKDLQFQNTPVFFQETMKFLNFMHVPIFSSHAMMPYLTRIVLGAPMDNSDHWRGRPVRIKRYYGYNFECHSISAMEMRLPQGLVLFTRRTRSTGGAPETWEPNLVKTQTEREIQFRGYHKKESYAAASYLGELWFQRVMSEPRLNHAFPQWPHPIS